MNNRFKNYAIAVVALMFLLLMILWLAGAFEEKISPGAFEAATPAKEATYTVVRKRLPVYEDVPATVHAKQSTDVSARLLARIDKIHVRAGDTVNQGDILIELEDGDLRARLAQTRQSLTSLNARLGQAKSEFDRTSRLFAKNAATQAALDRSTADYESLRAQRAAAVETRREAEAALSYTRVTAPISARVIDRFAEPGDMAAPGMKILTLYDPLSLRLEGQVRETLGISLRLGQELEVEIEALRADMGGTIEEIVPAANPGTRSFLIKVALPHHALVMPGMFARIRIPAGSREILLIPERFVVRVGQLDLVWVSGAHGKERRFVRLGKVLPEDMIEVRAGLEAGEHLLVPE